MSSKPFLYVCIFSAMSLVPAVYTHLDLGSDLQQDYPLLVTLLSDPHCTLYSFNLLKRLSLCPTTYVISEDLLIAV